jgi:DNA invertase Pin-like site-specific DNA recombinase
MPWGGCSSTSSPWSRSSLSDLIRLRTVEGMKVAKAKGRLKGKQPKLNRKQESHLMSLVHSGEYSTPRSRRTLFGVGRSTVYRAIQRQRLAAKGRTR